MMDTRTRRQRRGFTLVEVLIVVVILGILAATVLPQFTSAGEDAKESALVQDLQTLRSQIELYRFQHNGEWPAQGSLLEADFENAMLLPTTAVGAVGTIGDPAFPFGPYFIGQVPPNPFSGDRSVEVVATDKAADDGTGWIYNSATGRIKANSTGFAKDKVTKLEDL